jgi:hypothetical protein
VRGGGATAESMVGVQGKRASDSVQAALTVAVSGNHRDRKVPAEDGAGEVEGADDRDAAQRVPRLKQRVARAL